jgi:predicted metalloprotease
MRIGGNRQSGNVEDRRGGSKYIVGGGIGTIVIALIVFLLGGDPTQVLNIGQQQVDTQEQTTTDANDEGKQFVSVVLASTEDIWKQKFSEMGRSYEDPKLVLFTQQTMSGCGGASQATGPFYCPADNKIYLDLSFFRDLSNRFGSEGEFANAYVIAHEVGHHVQNLMGISTKVHQMQQRLGEAEANKLSVKLELQADFLAGYWAHYAENLDLTEEDIRSALSAANAIGDDRLQKSAQGYVVPDAFTHGTSEQRMKWFFKGYKSGNINDGDTFNDTNL